MSWTDEELETIFDRTSGKCHICYGTLTYGNYGKPGSRRAWEVEHSNAIANGGSDSLNNLYAAHIPCNRKKQARSTASARREHGRTRAPLSRKKRGEAKVENGLLAGAGTALLWAFLRLNPAVGVVATVVAAVAVYNADPDDFWD